MNKTCAKYISNLIFDREIHLNSQLYDIEQRANMTEHYRKLNTDLFGAKYFQYKGMEQENRS